MRLDFREFHLQAERVLSCPPPRCPSAGLHCMLGHDTQSDRLQNEDERSVKFSS